MMPHLRPILTAESMRAADEYTIERLGISGSTLMETAGREAARHIEDFLGPASEAPVNIYCGKGNNGGDGLVIARWLASRDFSVRVFLMDEEMSADAAQNLNIIQKIARERSDAAVSIAQFDSIEQVAESGPASLHVDALLGTGLTSELRSPMAELVSWINEHAAPTAAVDMPTGIHTDTGKVMGNAVRADVTITMGALKAGLVSGEGSVHAGDVIVVDIGIPKHVLADRAAEKGCGWFTTDAFVRASLPQRSPDAYKYSVGYALVIAGAPGMTGAPTMTSEAAARIGAGYVSCATPEPAETTLGAKLTEVTTIGLPVIGDGAIDPEEGFAAIEDALERAEAVAIGPGMGRKPTTLSFIQHVLEQHQKLVLVDADGLNALSDEWLQEHGRPNMLLTPHAGEFSRLAPDASLEDRFATVQSYAARWNVTLLLKGHPTLIATPNGATYAGSTGNSALATAGTGDVLSGFSLGLMAQGLSPDIAAACAVHLGGACADFFADERAPHSMAATDLIEIMPYVLHPYT